jgi:serine/threonine protein kinase
MQVMRLGHAEKSSDVYSFGVMMIELYSGAKPYVRLPGRTGFQVNPTFLDFPDWGLPEIRRLALKCISLDPKIRPEFIEVLCILKVNMES